MAQVFKGSDYTVRNRNSMEIVVFDEKDERSTLHVYTPTKKVYDELQEVAGFIDRYIEGEELGSDDIDACFEFTASAMSHNKEGRKITAETLESWKFDMEDVGTFISDYILFLEFLVEGKN